ncbi:MAG: fused MFS/spermidine synthase [Patescibacteria group bacterium]
MNRDKKIFLYSIVFGAGAAVMAIEMAASRLLAPYFGTSIFVWGSIIGVVLIALSLGYWIGGKYADKHPEIECLMLILVVAGLFATFIPILFYQFIEIIIARLLFGAELIIGSFFVMVILFFIPIFLLGMVSPFAIRISVSSVENSGKTAGNLYAFSTIGSILGTFLSSFWLIPFVGTRETIFISSSVLLLLGALGMKKNKFLFYLFVAIPIVFIFLFSKDIIKPSKGLVYEKETPYQYVQVVKEENSDRYLLLINDGHGVQSIYDPKNIILDNYYDYYSVLPYLHKNNTGDLDVLLIGLGGGTISHQYLNLFEDKYNLKIDGVEFDPGVITAAKEYFDLNNQDINIYTSDGRTFLRASDKKYDLIIVDAYAQQIYIPFHLSTQEYFNEVNEHLNENGILAMNINAIKYESRLLQSILQTVKSVYRNTYAVPLGRDGFNWLVVASDKDLEFDSMQKKNSIGILNDIVKEVAQKVITVQQDQSANILYDNKAPVELLTEKEILDFIYSNKKI